MLVTKIILCILHMWSLTHFETAAVNFNLGNGCCSFSLLESSFYCQ